MNDSRSRQWTNALALLCVCLLSGCATRPQTPRSNDGAWQDLAGQIVALDQTVQPEEARRAAACAYDCSAELGAEYRVVRPPLFHNFLVNVGLKKRGLCYHWAEDLSAALLGLSLRTIEVRWAMARAGTWREHNAVVLTAKGQAFEEGMLLDAWRHAGRLYWRRVQEDRYPWVEGESLSAN